ncbi:MAG: rhodanese-like domain-containing protein [Euryarchaeota archaeon]|nr:rhodanese-like domain-containing protein [Euryarchaeota archaeon]
MNKYSIIPTFVILFLLICPIVTSVPHYTNITAEEAYKMGISNKDIIFIDIREYKSFLKERIQMPDKVKCIPYYLIFRYKDPIPGNPDRSSIIDIFGVMLKNKNVILYCNIGKTSEFIAYVVSKYSTWEDDHVYNLIGGIEAWKEAGYPVQNL